MPARPDYDGGGNKVQRVNTRHLDASNPLHRQEAITLLSQGGLVAIPTETVYGLAADARNPQAVARIFTAKGRPLGHPLIVHIHDRKQLHHWVGDVPEHADRLAELFWPGALTLILPKHPSVSPVITGGLDSVAVRVPAHDVLRGILHKLNTGLAAPSANPYRGLSPTRAEHVLAGLDGRIDAVLDDGPCALGLESTIVDLTGTTPRLVRPGPISREVLQRALQKEFEDDHGQTAAPGNDIIHYRPRTPAYRADQDLIKSTLDNYREKGLRVGVISMAPYEAPHHGPAPQRWLQLPADKHSYGRDLYHTMHELDGSNVDVILIQQPPSTAEWLDVLNRLEKATDPVRVNRDDGL